MKLSFKYIKKSILIYSLWSVTTLTACATENIKDAVSYLNSGDYSTAEYRLNALAKKGDPSAELWLGILYSFSDDYNFIDTQKSLKWFRKAADRGLAEAQFHYAYMLSHAHITRPTQEELWNKKLAWKKALPYYLKAANQGHPGAQVFMGDIYYYGLGVDFDLTQAYAWYTLAQERLSKEMSKKLLLDKWMADLSPLLISDKKYSSAIKIADEWKKSYSDVKTSWQYPVY